MSDLQVEIAKLLKTEGYRVNEAIIDAIEDLVEVVDEENEGIDEDDDDEDGEDR